MKNEYPGLTITTPLHNCDPLFRSINVIHTPIPVVVSSDQPLSEDQLHAYNDPRGYARLLRIRAGLQANHIPMLALLSSGSMLNGTQET
jgi:hypothetical protein